LEIVWRDEVIRVAEGHPVFVRQVIDSRVPGGALSGVLLVHNVYIDVGCARPGVARLGRAVRRPIVNKDDPYSFVGIRLSVQGCEIIRKIPVDVVDRTYYRKSWERHTVPFALKSGLRTPRNGAESVDKTASALFVFVSRRRREEVIEELLYEGIVDRRRSRNRGIVHAHGITVTLLGESVEDGHE